MLNIKKIIFFLVVGVFLIGLTNVVFAVDWTANLTNIHRMGSKLSGDKFFAVDFTGTSTYITTTPSSTNQFSGISYLRNASSGNTYNGYVINITIINNNFSGNVYSFGIKKLNITLPLGLELVADSQNSSVASVLFSNVSGTVQG